MQKRKPGKSNVEVSATGVQLASTIPSQTPPRGAGGLMSWAVSKTAGPWV